MDTIHTGKMEGVEQVTKQCGNCRYWDRSNIKTVETYNHKISDCLSTDNIADSYVDIGSDGTLDKYPMIEQEGKNCPVYESAKNASNK